MQVLLLLSRSPWSLKRYTDNKWRYHYCLSCGISLFRHDSSSIKPYYFGYCFETNIIMLIFLVIYLFRFYCPKYSRKLKQDIVLSDISNVWDTDHRNTSSRHIYKRIFLFCEEVSYMKHKKKHKHLDLYKHLYGWDNVIEWLRIS